MSGGATSSARRRAGALWLVFGPIVWAVHFTLLYGAHTLLCALGGPPASRTVMIVVIIATLAALVVLAVPLGRGLPPPRPPPPDPVAVTGFIRSATVWLVILSAIAVIWAGATALLVTACGDS